MGGLVLASSDLCGRGIMARHDSRQHRGSACWTLGATTGVQPAIDDATLWVKVESGLTSNRMNS